MTSKQIAEAVKLTDAQREVLSELKSVLDKCDKMNIELVFYEGAHTLLAVNVPKHIELDYYQDIDDEEPHFILDSTDREVDIDDYAITLSNYIYEDNDFESLCWIEKQNNNN